MRLNLPQRLALLLAVYSLLLVACRKNGPLNHSATGNSNLANAPSQSENCHTVIHDFGDTVICGHPERIIALDPHALDLLIALNLEPIGYAEDGRALVGTPQSGQRTLAVKYLGERLSTLPIHVGTRQSPSLETLLKLKPDLILGRFHNQSQVETLSQIAPVLFPFQGESKRDHWQQSLSSLAKVVGRQSQAQQVIKTHQQQIAQAREVLKPMVSDRQLLLLSMSRIDGIAAFTETSFAGELLEDLGFKLLIPEGFPLTNGEIILSLEVMPQLSSDYIIIMASGTASVEQVKRLWEQHPILRSLPVTQAQKVYFVDYQLWSRITGPTASELIIEQVKDLVLE